MRSKGTKISEFNQYQKSDKVPFVTYADLECLIEETDGCKNNSENSFTKKQVSMFRHAFQCEQYHHLIEQKINMMYAEAKMTWKSLFNL